eukprot:GFYU01013575.1.p2 GENE.GFYU01013575.1~~GFYU01013575.1.p2  ORF type:complete len:142 (-),score=5.12 GFYU01013575.1:362-787(-)
MACGICGREGHNSRTCDESAHGNAGNNVKNLHHTSNCPHKPSSIPWVDLIGTDARYCMKNGCNTELTETQKRGCHVVYANQGTNSGTRYIVAMCARHNGDYSGPLNIRVNAKQLALEDCSCGHLEPPPWDGRRCRQCAELR